MQITIISTLGQEYTAINPEEYDNKYMGLYKIYPSPYSSAYLVYARCEGDALDELADWGCNNGMRGWFIDDNAILDYDDSEVLYVGNEGLPMLADDVYMTKASIELHHAISNLMHVPEE